MKAHKIRFKKKENILGIYGKEKKYRLNIDTYDFRYFGAKMRINSLKLTYKNSKT